MGKEHHILGVDVGGTGIKGGIVDISTGELVTERHRLDTPRPATPAAVAETFADLVDHFQYEGPVGVGFPAVVRRGVALSAANIAKSWINTSISDAFGAVSGLPIYALNDADAAGIAAMTFGAGRDYQQHVVLMVTVGTGIGTGLFVDGQLVPNTELGHVYLQHQKTDAENYVSNYLRKRYDWPWTKFGKRLNKYLRHVDMLFSPDLILIGGGVSKSFEKYERMLDVDAEVRPAQLLNSAGTVGAAIYAYSRNVG